MGNRIKLRLYASLVFSVLIKDSSMPNQKLTSDVVCAITMTRTFCIDWFGAVKSQETGIN